MKRLTITGMNGVRLADCVLDVVGDSYLLNFPLPVFLPVVEISLTELPEAENKGIVKMLDDFPELVERLKEGK